MKVLVTGATTPLGVALVEHLVAQPWVEHVLAIAREPAGPFASSRVTYASCDLTRARTLHDLLWGPGRRLGIDTVIHGALHRSARDRGTRIRAENVGITRQLLAALERHPTIRRLVLRSGAEVYALRDTEPNLLDEDAPLELDPAAPQWVRDRVEADLTTCARMCSAGTAIAVARCAEVLAPASGSQLWDYLQTRVCLRPLGFDPMINLLSVADHARALALVARSSAVGVFNIPGADTLPLSRIVTLAGRLGVPLPGPLLHPLYQLRTWTIGLEFRYDLNLRRFHFGGVLDGTRAQQVLGYRPRHPIWPRPNGEPPGARGLPRAPAFARR